MATKRVKKTVKAAKSREEIEMVMADYAAADAKYQKLNATMDQAIIAIRNKHEEEINQLKATIETKVEDLQLFATTNPELFEKAKSIDFVHGCIGFRTGTPKVNQLRKLKWPAILALMKKKLPDYVRIKVEVAKDKLISDRDNKAVNKHFDYCGIEIVQDETFFVELKKEAAE